MSSTIVYSQKGNIIVTKTLRETAIALTGKRGAFNVQDILFALKCQGVETITAAQVSSQLYYDGSSYRGRKDLKRRWHTLEKKKAGWYVWHLWGYDSEGNPVEIH